MAPKLLTSEALRAHGGDAAAPEVAQAEVVQRGPWIVPDDPLEAEWAAVRRTISAQELAKLEEFRSLVKANGLDDHKACTVDGAAPHSQKAATLLRFLRARGGNCEAASAMLKEALDWRSDFEVDRKLREWRSEWAAGTSARVRLLRKYEWIKQIGQCREGLPVYIHRHSTGDVGGVVSEIGSESLLLYLVSNIEDQLERAHQRMMKTGNCITNFVEIHDLGNYGYVPNWLHRAFACVPFFKAHAPIFDKVYPERVRVCIMVRAPAAFSMVWKVFSPLVPEATKSKIHIHGYHARAWLSDLQSLLPPETIPAFLRTDDASALKQALPAGGVVPKGALQALKLETATQKM